MMDVISAQPLLVEHWGRRWRTGRAIDPALRDGLLDLFGYTAGDLDLKIPPARIHGGADHVALA
jgi:hypothetical protein